MPRIFVFMGLGQDPEQTARLYAEDRAPDRTAYGFHLAAAEGFDVAFSHDADPLGRGLARRIGFRLFGVDVIHAFRNRRAIRDADAVWAMSERESLAVTLVMRLGLAPKRPVISSSVWMWSEWARTGAARRFLYRQLFKALSVMTVQSEPCLRIARAAAPALPTELMYFGINDERFTPLEQDAKTDGVLHILAAGNDPTRDWPTLLEAVGGDTRYRVRLICPWVSDESVAGYANVERADGSTLSAFRDHYRWADVVAIPMVDNAFSGITVALEAAAQKRAILSSDTGGVPTYFGRDEAIYVPTGDIAAMRETLAGISRADLAAYAERAHTRFTRSGYTTRRMIADYARLTRTALGGAD